MLDIRQVLRKNIHALLNFLRYLLKLKLTRFKEHIGILIFLKVTLLQKDKFSEF